MGRVSARVFADDGDLVVEGGDVGGLRLADAEGDAHGGGDSDGGRAADDHVADDGGDLLVVGGEDVGLLEGKLGLIEEVNAVGEPFEGGNHVSSSLLVLLQRNVGGADVGGSEDGVEGGVGGGGFYIGSAALFAVHEAEDSDDVHAGGLWWLRWR